MNIPVKANKTSIQFCRLSAFKLGTRILIFTHLEQFNAVLTCGDLCTWAVSGRGSSKVAGYWSHTPLGCGSLVRCVSKVAPLGGQSLVTYSPRLGWLVTYWPRSGVIGQGSHMGQSDATMTFGGGHGDSMKQGNSLILLQIEMLLEY